MVATRSMSQKRHISFRRRNSRWNHWDMRQRRWRRYLWRWWRRQVRVENNTLDFSDGAAGGVTGIRDRDVKCNAFEDEGDDGVGVENDTLDFGDEVADGVTGHKTDTAKVASWRWRWWQSKSHHSLRVAADDGKVMDGSWGGRERAVPSIEAILVPTSNVSTITA